MHVGKTGQALLEDLVIPELDVLEVNNRLLGTSSSRGASDSCEASVVSSVTGGGTAAPSAAPPQINTTVPTDRVASAAASEPKDSSRSRNGGSRGSSRPGSRAGNNRPLSSNTPPPKSVRETIDDGSVGEDDDISRALDSVLEEVSVLSSVHND